MRFDLRQRGGDVRFGARMTKINFDGDSVSGVDVEYSPALERSGGISDGNNILPYGSMETIDADAVVLATGHSARDVYEELHKIGVKLEAKGFSSELFSCVF